MLGERIACLRRARGISQSELARRLKISASAMGMYEQGRREPSAQMLVLLAQELEVSTDYLLTGQSSPSHEDLRPILVAYCVDAATKKFEQRVDQPFTRQDLTILFTALLTD